MGGKVTKKKLAKRHNKVVGNYDHYYMELESRIKNFLVEKSPVDTGDLKSGWKVEIKHLREHSKNRQRCRVLISSNTRHAKLQMYGWNAVPGQLLTGYKMPNGKWHILKASKPRQKFLDLLSKAKHGRKKKRSPLPNGKVRSFITKGGQHFSKSRINYTKDKIGMKASIEKIISEVGKKHKLIVEVFLPLDYNYGKESNMAKGRIRQWMRGTLGDKPLNSTATEGLVTK